MSLPTLHPYYPAVDGLRAVAVLTVVAFHIDAAWLPGGFLGVDVFFAISGFVVTAALYRRRDLPLLRFVRVFYVLRIRRIIPALFVCVLVTYLLSFLFIPPVQLQEIRWAAIASLLGVSNFFFASQNLDYFGLRMEGNPFAHVWSLSIEEQFYVIYPLLSYAAFRLLARGRAGELAVTLPLVLSFGYFCYLGATGANFYYDTFARIWEILAGAQLFFILNRLPPHALSARAADALFVCGAIGLAVSMVFADAARFLFFPLVSLSCCAVIAACVAGAHNNALTPRLLAWPPMVHIGLLSYALYLWHWPILTIFRWTVSLEIPAFLVLALAVTYLCALASGSLVERPMKGAIGRRPAASLIAVGAVYAIALFGIEESGRASAKGDVYTPLAFRGIENPHDWDESWKACHHRQTTLPREQMVRDCLTRRSHAGPAIFVIGDSHTNAIFFAFKRAFGDNPAIGLHDIHNNGVPVLLRKGGIPPEITFAVEQMQPGDIMAITFFRAAMYETVEASFNTSMKDDPMAAPGVKEHLSNGEKSLNAVARELAARGATMLLIRDGPQLAKPLRVQACMLQRSIGLPNACDIDRNLSLHRRIPMDRLIDRVAAGNPNVRVWDLHPLVCPDARCTFYRDGRIVMVDNNHISQAESEALAPALRQFFEQYGLLPAAAAAR